MGAVCPHPTWRAEVPLRAHRSLAVMSATFTLRVPWASGSARETVVWATGGKMALRLPIKVKVAAAMSVPLAVLMVMAVIEVGRSTREAEVVREQTDMATATTGPSGVVPAIQT